MTTSLTKCCRHLRIAVVAAVVLIVAADAARSQQPLAGLAPGPYGVGFRTQESYDYSRAFRPKKNYFGELLPGERARPMQICVWYPAQPAADQYTMTYSEYAFPYPEDERFIDFLSNIQNRENGLLLRLFNNDGGRVLELMSVPLQAVRNAPPASGPFPLIIYHPHWQTGITENIILCEYLAGCGYVVATTHPLSTHSLATTGSASDLESMVRDKEFILSELRGDTLIDHDKLGVLGTGSGGTTALLLQMRNSDVEAVAALVGTFADHAQLEQVRHNPYYDSAGALVPLLHLYCPVEGATDLSLFTSLKYTPRYSTEIKGVQPQDFSNYEILSPSDSSVTPTEVQVRAYRAICRMVRAFFDAELKGDQQAQAFLNSPPADLGGPEFLAHQFLPGQDVPPTQQQFVDIISNNQVGVAIELYEKFRKQDPDLILFPEAAMNVLGYRFLQRGSADDAVALFKLNAECYPRSANVWDSLADGYLGQGDNQHALECYRRVLEVLPGDTNIGEDLKTTLRNNAEQGIQRLGQ
jgi:hypothetical protein